MFPKDISQGIRERGGPAKERLERNPNGIYNALKRMVEDGHIVRVGERVYTVGLFNALKQAGKLEEEDDDEQFSIAEAILGIVARGEVLTAAQIIRKLRENPIALDKMRRNPQYSYAAMSRLVSKGQLIKDGPHSYRRPTTKEKIAHLL
jgi:hypothetical protein